MPSSRQKPIQGVTGVTNARGCGTTYGFSGCHNGGLVTLRKRPRNSMDIGFVTLVTLSNQDFLRERGFDQGGEHE
jgi:hypothetical protein